MKSSSNEKEINPHQSNCTKTNTVVPVLQYFCNEKNGLTRGIASFEKDNLVVFY
jgi:hypothetical protein